MGTEAAFHPIEEYMLHVEEQFQHLARRVHVDKKRVYLATDDPSLLQEAKTKSVPGSVCVCVRVCVCACVRACVRACVSIMSEHESRLRPSLLDLTQRLFQVSRLRVHQR